MRGLHVGERERDRLVLDDRPAELLARLGVVERHLVRRPRDADRLRADRGSGALEGRHRGVRPAGPPPSRARASRASSFSLPPSRQRPGSRTWSSTTSAVCEARMPCLSNFWPWLSPLRAGRYHEAGLAAGAQLGVDDRGDDVHVGDAAVGGPGLGAVEDPLVVRLVVRRAGAHRADVAAGVGLGGAERRELEVARACRTSAAPTRRSARGCRWRATAAAASAVPTMARPMPASPQNSSSIVSGHAEPGLVEALGGQEVERVEADLGGLLEHRPRELLALVPLGGGRPDHVGGEVVQPVPELDVVLVQLEGRSHATRLAGRETQGAGNVRRTR